MRNEEGRILMDEEEKWSSEESRENDQWKKTDQRTNEKQLWNMKTENEDENNDWQWMKDIIMKMNQ